jgi:hypothetical protein
MEVVDAELWQLVDERLEQVRRLNYDELLRRTAADPELELLKRQSGTFRRRTRVIACPNDRLGIRVRVDAEGRRRPAEGGIVITSSGAPAPEWSGTGEHTGGNPFAFGPRVTLAGLAVSAVLLLLFVLLA